MDAETSVVPESMPDTVFWLSDILSLIQIHGVSNKKSKPEIT